MDVFDYARQFLHDLVGQGWPVFWARQEKPRYIVKIKADDTDLQEALDRTVAALRDMPWDDLCEGSRLSAVYREIMDEAARHPIPPWLRPEYDPDGGYCEYDETHDIEVTHVVRPVKHAPVRVVHPLKVVGASITRSDDPPYDAGQHQTLEDIEAGADIGAAGVQMAFISGACRWWTTDIHDCYMEALDAAECACKRPCCPHCGEPLVMVPLAEFLGRAREYVNTFGRLGLWALELAHAANLGRLMCLADWDMYADAVDAHAMMLGVPGPDNDYAD